MRKHPAGLVQGIRGTPAPMVKFLPNASAALIQGVAGEVYDVEGIHDCPCVGEFFSGCAFEPGESIHRYDLDVLAPRVGAGGQPGFEDLLGAARDHVQEPRGAAAFADGRQVQDNGDVFVSVGGVAPHVFIHPAMTRTPSKRAGSLISRRSPSVRTAVLAVFQDTPRAWETRATVKWWTTRPTSAQRTAECESFARGWAAWLMSWRHT